LNDGMTGNGAAVRRETDKAYDVRVLYGEGYTHHNGPEPCAVDREVGGEASAGGGIGQPLSRESHIISGADGVAAPEGDADRRRDERDDDPARRGLRPWHVLRLRSGVKGDLPEIPERPGA
jgi:hypothetical protein